MKATYVGLCFVCALFWMLGQRSEHTKMKRTSSRGRTLHVKVPFAMNRHDRAPRLFFYVPSLLLFLFVFPCLAYLHIKGKGTTERRGTM
ncbi:MAG: hypothetical protein JOS17DRAFT_744028, partial [Linnemannia elongata]